MILLLMTTTVVFLVVAVLCAIKTQSLLQKIRDLEFELEQERILKQAAQKERSIAASALNSNKEFFLRHRMETGNWRGY